MRRFNRFSVALFLVCLTWIGLGKINILPAVIHPARISPAFAKMHNGMAILPAPSGFSETMKQLHPDQDFMGNLDPWATPYEKSREKYGKCLLNQAYPWLKNAPNSLVTFRAEDGNSLCVSATTLAIVWPQEKNACACQ
jgi:hypothetical protein